MTFGDADLFSETFLMKCRERFFIFCETAGGTVLITSGPTNRFFSFGF